MIVRRRIFLVVASVFSVAQAAHAQVDPKLYSDMKWREIGPMRAGRTRALAGIPSEPATFYLGAVNGGVWKTTDAGATWHSVWDSEPTGSIGSIAVSESDPNIVYVASGEGLQLSLAFMRIKDPKVRKRVLDLVKSLAEEKDEDDE